MPLISPYFFKACIEYTEHVGVYLHALGNKGEIDTL